MRTAAALPSPIFVVLATGLLAAGCSKPTALAFSEAPPTMLFRGAPIPLPAVRATSASGELVETGGKIRYTASPSGRLLIEDATFSPLANGDVTLTATLEGTDLFVSHPMTVRLVDRVKLDCARPNCQWLVGEPVEFSARALSAGAAVEAPITWRVSAPKRLALEPDGKGKALAAGDVDVTVEVGGVSAKKQISISAKAERLTLDCPTDRWRTTDTGRACTVSLYRTMQLELTAHGGGAVVRNPRVKWSTSDIEHAEVKRGVVTGVEDGSATITAEVDGVTASIEVQIIPGDKICRGDYDKRVRLLIPTAEGKRPRRVTMHCVDDESVVCAERLAKNDGLKSDVEFSCCCH